MTTPTAAGSMDFLALCQAAAMEAGVASASVTALPTSVTAQTGELARIVNYVSRAWIELQGNRRWSWMWEAPTLVIAPGASSVAQNVATERYDKESAYVPAVSSDNAGHHLDYLPWDEFRDLYPRIQGGSSLGVWTVRPDMAFQLNGIVGPAGYSVTVERYANPTQLRLATDVPQMPADLHYLLVYMAVRKYGGYDEAGTQYKLNAEEERRLRSELITRCTPAPRLGGSLFDYL